MSSSKPRLVFAGTPEFASHSLAALLALDALSVVAVYTQPDRPAGRGRQTTFSPVKQLAQSHDLPVYQPLSLKTGDAQAELKALQPDLLVVVAYGLLLPEAVLRIPRLGCVNVHASLLPRWRGAAPIQRALLAGDRETGITIMQMEAGLDTGPMLLRTPCTIAPTDTSASLHDRLATLGAEALAAAIPGILAGRLEPQPQDERLATYAAKLTREEACLDFRQPADSLARAVRGYFPKPIATAVIDGQSMRILAAEALPTAEDAASPGSRLEHPKDLLIATGSGALRITSLQLPGKRPILGTDYLNAQRAQRN